MPRINQRMEYCPFYLFQVNPAAPDTVVGPGATGFFVARLSTINVGEQHIYAVTNRHVIERHWAIIRVNTYDGGTRLIPTEPLSWQLSSTSDLAVLDVTDLLDDATDFIGFVYTSDFLTADRIRQYRVGVGDQVVMMGLFADHDGGATNLPVGRFGSIAAMPDPERPVKASKKDVRASPAFLNDMRSRTGFSGSPVWIWRIPGDDRGGDAAKPPFPGVSTTGHTLNYTFLCFLGIHRAQFPEKTFVISGAPAIPEGTEIEIASAMTIVVPAWEIAAALEWPHFSKQRVERDKRPERIERARGRVRVWRAEEKD